MKPPAFIPVALSAQEFALSSLRRTHAALCRPKPTAAELLAANTVLDMIKTSSELRDRLAALYSAFQDAETIGSKKRP